MRIERTLERIGAVFAEAIAAGRFEEAEGWLAVARLASDRLWDHRPNVARPWPAGHPVQRT
jgi:hypothetical protein